jgi:uncharacterized protein (DUF2235 family)
MAKQIFIFNDGTGQDATSKSVSNVFKLFSGLPGKIESSAMECDLYKVSKDLNYHSLYFRGIGTEDLRKKPETKAHQSLWQRLAIFLRLKAELTGELVTGSAIKDRVEAVIADVEKIWSEGDKIYFVGFSRGASSVRIAVSYLKELLPNFKVEYVLLFDTVYSVLEPVQILNFPVITHFDDKNIGLHVRRCDHLISGDEMRNMFPLTPISVRPEVRQIMFAGAHSDVGGGAALTSLSDITLQFSIEEFRHEGVSFDSVELLKFNIKPECAAEISWDLFNGTGQTHYPRDFKSLDFQIHKSVFERCARGASTPIALAGLIGFKTTSSSELTNRSEIEVDLSTIAAKPTSLRSEISAQPLADA